MQQKLSLIGDVIQYIRFSDLGAAINQIKLSFRSMRMFLPASDHICQQMIPIEKIQKTYQQKQSEIITNMHVNAIN